jgi:hypothetical protein
LISTPVVRILNPHSSNRWYPLGLSVWVSTCRPPSLHWSKLLKKFFGGNGLSREAGGRLSATKVPTAGRAPPRWVE